jgi:hypothetical protein
MFGTSQRLTMATKDAGIVHGNRYECGQPRHKARNLSPVIGRNTGDSFVDALVR